MKTRTGNWLFGMVMILIVGISMMATSCTENTRAKSFGGKMTINLEQNVKLVNVTWKESDMWILTRPMRAGETPEVYKFVEKSSFGVMEGEITIVEYGAMKPISYNKTPAEMDIQMTPIIKEMPVEVVYLGKN